jgi:hypothetical protein
MRTVVDLVTYKKWAFRVDREATLQAYSAVAKGGPDECGCLYCRNFVAARELVYPGEFRALLERLGIDYRKESEVWEVSPDKSRIRFYSGLFHFIGAIASGDRHEPPCRVTLRQTNTTLTDGSEPIGDSFAFVFSNRRDLVRAPFKGHNLVQMDFFVEVPWVLDEEPGM